MNILRELFSDQFIHALGWTLVHSLWQGILIGLVIAVAMVLLHKYTARIRYFINSLGLFLVAALALLTFITSYTAYKNENVENHPVRSLNITYESHQTSLSAYSEEREGLSFNDIIESTAVYCREHFLLFVTVWLLGMFAMMLRFLGGYALVKRYRNHRVKPVIGAWEKRFAHLAWRIGVNKNIRLLESALVRVPMAIGYLKPVILLPLGALNGVPVEQMEAILVHELAHIRRRDYLMNLIQSLMEVIFFYHPVVWWLSKNIRIERENICDDIAITITGNTMEFAKALTNIQEINLGAPGLAAGLRGKNKNRLVNRIRRLTGKPKLQSGFTEGLIAASILVVSMIGLSAAAMITYPSVDMPVAPLSFDESGIVLPDFAPYPDPAALPDTTDKEKQIAKEKAMAEKEHYLQQKVDQAEKENLQHQKEMQHAIQAEMKAAQKEMEAAHQQMQQLEMKNLQKELMEANKQAMKAYQDAMKEIKLDQIKDSTLWMHSLPQLYFQGSDSLVWTHKYPGNFYFYADSLNDLYYDNLSDHFENYENIFFMHQEKLKDLQEDLMEMEALKNLEGIEPLELLPDLDYDFDYDFDYDIDRDIDHDYSLHQRFLIPGKAERIITAELREDGLIDHGHEYIVLIDKKQMLINGEKQDKAVFKKYSRLLDSLDVPFLLHEDEVFRVHIGH